MVTSKEKWFNNIGDHHQKDPLDDMGSIDLDIGKLVSKFLRPIDMCRSHTSPNINGDLNQPDLTPSSQPMESRCHTFYRMLGLPTIAPDGSFFNPGFPLMDKDRQKDICDKMQPANSSIKKSIADREQQARYRTNLFSIRNADSVILSLSLAIPDGQRKFAINPGTLDDATSKPQVIPIRTQYINKFFQNTDKSSIVNKFETVSHQLAPFITDPIIAANVEPKSGSNSVLIGVPFLDKKDLEFESGKYAKRPGLEFILRIKLREQNLFDQLQMGSSVQQSMPVLTKDSTGLISLGISEEDATRLFQTGLVDIYTVDDLLKTYNGLINMFYNATRTIETVSKQIMWIPMPGNGGPESGSVVSTSFIQPRYYLDSWEIEKRIANLKVKSLLAKYQLDIGQNLDNTNLGYADFAISEFQNVSNTFSEDLSNEKSKRAAIEKQGSDALRIIELLGGEISGLGLIDIVAIYLSLWSMDVATLLEFIDDAAADRLNKITELKTEDTANRAGKKGNALKAYSKLSAKITEILEHGDYVLNRLKGSPKEGGTGDVVRNSG